MIFNLIKSNYKSIKEEIRSVLKFYLKMLKLEVLVRDKFKFLVMILYKVQLFENNIFFFVVDQFFFNLNFILVIYIVLYYILKLIENI